MRWGGEVRLLFATIRVTISTAPQKSKTQEGEMNKTLFEVTTQERIDIP